MAEVREEKKKVEEAQNGNKPPLAPGGPSQQDSFMTPEQEAAIRRMFKSNPKPTPKPKLKTYASDPGVDRPRPSENEPDAAPLSASDNKPPALALSPPLIFKKNPFFNTQLKIFPQTIALLKKFTGDISSLNLTTFDDFSICLKIAISGKQWNVVQELLESINHAELKHHRNKLGRFLSDCCEVFVYTEPDKSIILNVVKFILKHCRMTNPVAFNILLNQSLVACTQTSTKNNPQFLYSLGLFWILLQSFKVNATHKPSISQAANKIFLEILNQAKQKLQNLLTLYKKHKGEETSMARKAKKTLILYGSGLQEQTQTLSTKAGQYLNTFIKDRLSDSTFFGPLFEQMSKVQSEKQAKKDKVLMTIPETMSDQAEEEPECLELEDMPEITQLDQMTQNWLPKYESDLSKIESLIQVLSPKIDHIPAQTPKR